MQLKILIKNYFHFNATVTKYTPVDKYIQVTWNFNRDTIINSTYYVLIIRPICLYYFIPSIRNCRYYICFIVVKFEFTVLFIISLSKSN